MNHFLTKADWIFWAVKTCLDLALIVALLRRPVRWPVWFLWLIFSLSKSVLLMAISVFGTYSQYFWIYWSLGGIESGIFLCLALEVFKQVFSPFRDLPTAARSFISWGFLFLVVILVIASFDAGSTHWMMSAILSAQQSVRFATVGCYLLIYTLAKYLGLGRTHTLRYIVMGWLVLSLFQMADAKALAVMPVTSHHWVRLIGMFGAIAGRVIWLIGLSRRPEMKELTAGELENFKDFISKWSSALGARRNAHGKP